MIDSSAIRAPYQKFFVNPLARVLSPAISPQTISLIACCFGVAVAPFLAYDRPYLALFCLLITGYLDTLDGTVARMSGRVSAKGAVVDIVSDRFVEASIIFGLFLVHPEARAEAAFLMLASVLVCVTSFLVVGLFLENRSEKSFYYSPGLMERTEAFLFFVAMILFPNLFFPLSCVFTILVFYTAFKRVFDFLRDDKMQTKRL
jgi:archaetidylinositol phosphate synthase